MGNAYVWVATIVTLIALGLIFGAVAGFNHLWNSQELQGVGFHSYSHAKPISGHVEYTIYADGTQDVKIYHWFGHRTIDSTLYQDLNGDDRVDRIRKNGSELKANSLRKILIREYDYEEHKDEFDKADAELQKLKQKYRP